MNQFLNKHKQTITRQILFVFVVSWFSLIGQATAHTFMMAEMQQHQAMGHDMSSHCQPVLCESVIALDDQSGHGIDSIAVLDLNALPATISFYMPLQLNTAASLPRFTSTAVPEPPPLIKTGMLRV